MCMEKGNWYLRVFKTVQWSAKVKGFNIEAHESSTFGAKNIVPQDLGRGHVCCVCSELTRVLDQVPTGCYSHTVRVVFWESEINYKAGICDNSILRNMPDFVVCYYKDGASSWGLRIVIPLSHVAKFFSKCC